MNSRVDVIATFYSGKFPVPRKVRLKFPDMPYATLTVDNILGEPLELQPGGLHRILYECESTTDDGRLLKYQLVYNVRGMYWEIVQN